MTNYPIYTSPIDAEDWLDTTGVNSPPGYGASNLTDASVTREFRTGADYGGATELVLQWNPAIKIGTPLYAILVQQANVLAARIEYLPTGSADWQIGENRTIQVDGADRGRILLTPTEPGEVDDLRVVLSVTAGSPELNSTDGAAFWRVGALYWFARSVVCDWAPSDISVDIVEPEAVVEYTNGRRASAQVGASYAVIDLDFEVATEFGNPNTLIQQARRNAAICVEWSYPPWAIYPLELDEREMRLSMSTANLESRTWRLREITHSIEAYNAPFESYSDIVYDPNWTSDDEQPTNWAIKNGAYTCNAPTNPDQGIWYKQGVNWVNGEVTLTILNFWNGSSLPDRFGVARMASRNRFISHHFDTVGLQIQERLDSSTFNDIITVEYANLPSFPFTSKLELIDSLVRLTLNDTDSYEGTTTLIQSGGMGIVARNNNTTLPLEAFRSLNYQTYPDVIDFIYYLDVSNPDGSESRAQGNCYAWDGEKVALHADPNKPIQIGVKPDETPDTPTITIDGKPFYPFYPPWTEGESLDVDDIRWLNRADGTNVVVTITEAHTAPQMDKADSGKYTVGKNYIPDLGVLLEPEIEQLSPQPTAGQGTTTTGTTAPTGETIPSLIEGEAPIPVYYNDGLGRGTTQWVTSLAGSGIVDGDYIVISCIVEWITDQVSIPSATTNLTTYNNNGEFELGKIQVDFPRNQVSRTTKKAGLESNIDHYWRWLAPNVIQTWTKVLVTSSMLSGTDMRMQVQYAYNNPGRELAIHCVNIAKCEHWHQPIPYTGTKPASLKYDIGSALSLHTARGCETASQRLFLIDSTPTSKIGLTLAQQLPLGNGAEFNTWLRKDTASNQWRNGVSAVLTLPGYQNTIEDQYEVPGTRILRGCAPGDEVGIDTESISDPIVADQNRLLFVDTKPETFIILRGVAWWNKPNVFDFNELFGPQNYKKAASNVLPLFGHWTTGKHPSSIGFSPSAQVTLLQEGRRLWPWLEMPAYDRAIDQEFIDYYEAPLAYFRANQLPLCFISTQWEYLLSEEPYLSLPFEDNPNVFDLTEQILDPAKVCPFGPVEHWQTIGNQWTSSPAMAQIQAWYPDPPAVTLLSNNEHPKLKWHEAEQSKRYVDLYGLGQTDDFKSRVVNEGFTNRYSAMFNAMKAGLTPAWGSLAKCFGYNAHGPMSFARWASWPQYSRYQFNQIDSNVFSWDGCSIPYYLHNTSETVDYKVFSPQVEACNLVFMLKEALTINPTFMRELSIWDGGPDKKADYIAAGQEFTSVRYKGFAQFGLWLIRPNIIREFRGWTWDYDETADYTEGLMDVIDKIHENQTLTQFWRDGKLVHNDEENHPYQVSVPVEYAAAKRWYMLTSTSNPDPILWQLETELKVYALCLELDELYLVYAFAPQGDELTQITVPSVGSIAVTARQEGSFFLVNSGGAVINEI